MAYVAATMRRGEWVRLDQHGPAWQPEQDMASVVDKVTSLRTTSAMAVLDATTEQVVWEQGAAPIAPTTLF